MSTSAKTAVNVQGAIAQAVSLSERLDLLVRNDRQHVTKTERDCLCLLHWSLIFDHHQGMLLLLQHGFHAPAFALMRPLEEAFLRLFVVMNGTERQVEAVWNGTYNTEFDVVWKQVYEKVGVELKPHFEPWLKERTKALHGFTHGGKEQLVRQKTGPNIVSSYTDDEVVSLIQQTVPIAFFTALFTTAFLGYQAEHQSAAAMVNEYAQGAAGSAAK
jgi:hypothetical protein